MKTPAGEVEACNELGKSRNLRVIEKISAGKVIYQIRRGNVTLKTISDYRHLKKAVVLLL
jgi:hypothetical protein